MSGKPPEKTLLLVDGSSYLYRAFHAMPELRSPAGAPTGAIYGVINMLRRLAADHKASARACVFDAKGPTFRDDLYAAYKATRAPMPDELAAQIEPLIETVRALGWPVLAISGVEADDVIGTLATRATALGWRTIVSTGDKDLAQLVDASVTLVNTMTNETLDPEGVQKKFGVPPTRIVDYLALVGDTVDNVPGVPKVGPKTAVKWLAAYDSLDTIMARADEFGGVVGENLRKTLAWLPQARELVTVKRDVPLPVDLDGLADGQDDPEKLRTLVEQFGFRSLMRELNAAPADTPPTASAVPGAAAKSPSNAPPVPSTTPPAGYGTITFTGLEGNAWPVAARGSAARAAASARAGNPFTAVSSEVLVGRVGSAVPNF